MYDGLDWLLRPVLSNPPLCRWYELDDGTYDLADIAQMNDALDVRDHNQFLMQEAMRK